MFLPCLPMCLQLLTDMAFTNNWFKETYELLLSRQDFVDLLGAATKGQLFGFSMVSCMNRRTSGGSRPSDKRGRSSRSRDKKWGGGGGLVSKKIFRHFALRVSFWFKYKGGPGPPGAPHGSATADGVAMGSPCVCVAKDWSRKARCAHTTGDLLMTH